MSKRLLYAIEVSDKGTPKIRDFTESLKASEKHTNQLSKEMGKADRSSSKFAETTARLVKSLAKIGVAAGAAVVSLAAVAGVKLARAVASTGMAFEKLGTQLTTLKGAESAKETLGWLSDFAKTTPFLLGEVAQAFVKLESQGLNGQRWMKTLGDTASSMGRTLDEAVEMFADAMVGEFERLKEFGVRADKVGDEVTFSWTENGQAMQVTAAKTATGISTALEGIFDRFTGGMEAQSKTLEGILSNLSGQWTAFKRLVADAGFYQFLKTQFEDILATVNNLANDGTLQYWAQQISNSFVTVGTTIKTWISDLTGWYRSNTREIESLVSIVVESAKVIGSIISGINWVRNNNPLAYAAQGAGFVAGKYGGNALNTVNGMGESVMNTYNSASNTVVNNVISPMFMTGDRTSLADAAESIKEQDSRWN